MATIRAKSSHRGRGIGCGGPSGWTSGDQLASDAAPRPPGKRPVSLCLPDLAERGLQTARKPVTELKARIHPGRHLSWRSRHAHRLRPVEAVTADGHRDAISREALAGLSPYQTEHINRFGDYVLDLGRPRRCPPRSRRGHSRRARQPHSPRQSLCEVLARIVAMVHVGKEIAGVVRGGNVSWTFGRGKGLGV